MLPRTCLPFDRSCQRKAVRRGVPVVPSFSRDFRIGSMIDIPLLTRHFVRNWWALEASSNRRPMMIGIVNNTYPMQYPLGNWRIFAMRVKFEGLENEHQQNYKNMLTYHLLRMNPGHSSWPLAKAIVCICSITQCLQTVCQLLYGQWTKETYSLRFFHQ